MMRKKAYFYYGKKLLTFFLSLLLLSAAVFYIAHLAPGDPLLAYYGDHAEKMSVAERAWAEERLGLNDPMLTQYLRWLKNALHGSFGISYQYKTDVLEVTLGRLGNTLLLGGVGFVLIFVLALGLGILCVWQEGKWIDRFLCRVGTMISCIPEFWLSLVLILIFAIYLRWFPSGGAYSPGKSGDISDRIWHLILPLLVVVGNHLWYYAYMMRNTLLEEVRTEYVLLAKAKGLDKRRILCRHCLRNCMPSYLSIMAISVPHILGGTYIVETVFSYPGIGTLSYESARYQDYPLLMLLCILTGAVVILCSLIAQTINERIDPRMREREIAEGTEVRKVG